MEKFNQDVRRVLTQRIPRTADKNHQLIIKNYKDTVDRFINDVVTPLWELEESTSPVISSGDIDPVAALNLNSSVKGLTLPQIPKLFNVYSQGTSAIASLAKPFNPIEITEESVNKVIDYFKDLEIDEYYNLGQRFIQDSFVVVSSWFRDISLQKAVDLVYNKYQPFEWVEQLESLKDELDVVPEDIKEMLQKMQMYLGANA
jgi:hypothetical protein